MDRAFATSTSPPPVTSRKTCERCINYRASVKETSGRGLCVLYSLIVGRDGSCRFGFQSNVTEGRADPKVG